MGHLTVKYLNGWQRIWLVFTIALSLWCLLYMPVKSYVYSARADAGYRKNIQADFDSGNCDAYINGALAQLTEPPYFEDGGTCWFIFKTRTTYKIEKIPFTKNDAENHELWERFKSIGGVFFTGLLVLLGCSGLLYLVGLAVARIRKGLA